MPPNCETIRRIKTEKFLNRLFRKGHANLPYRFEKPTYADMAKDEVVLNVDALREPDKFCRALCDYHKSVGNTARQSISNDPEILRRHIENIYAHLIRSRNDLQQNLTGQYISDIIAGNSAEFLATTLIRNMLRAFDTGQTAVLWEKNEEDEEDEKDKNDIKWHLGDKYYFKLHPPANATLLEEISGYGNRISYKSKGEYDGVINIGTDVLFVLDITSSPDIVTHKMSSQACKISSFREFRASMQRLFVESGQQEGFCTVALMHISCSARNNYFEVLRKDDLSGEGVIFGIFLNAKEELRSIIECSKEEMKNDGLPLDTDN